MERSAQGRGSLISAGLRLCLTLLSVSVVGFLAGCGGSSSSGGSGGSGGNGGGGGTTGVATGTWVWEEGSNTGNQNGTYGTSGTAAAGNAPGARYRAAGWTDTSGNFWLFGGYGYDSVGTANGLAGLNDLWKYSPGTGEWTWMSGSSIGDATGSYGTQGTASAGNVPGARVAPTSWTDASGNFWLFGGDGIDSSGIIGELNDLWKYSPSTGEWTWVAGAKIGNQTGTYGTLGTSASANVPGGRQHGASWIDGSGNLWLFGGEGCDVTGSASCSGFLSDLWTFNPTTGRWTWTSGPNVANQDGKYGTKGTAAAGNVPGSRNVAVSWVDGSGNLWLFGGVGYDSAGTESGDAYLNDLWQYSPSSSQWTWVSGSNIGNQAGTYGTEGTAAAANVPGGRWGGSNWIDSSGNLWLFGGLGVTDALGDTGEFSDVWEYSPVSGEWTWQDGAETADHDGTYGTKGTGSSSNLPGGRERSVTWKDSSGNVDLRWEGLRFRGNQQRRCLAQRPVEVRAVAGSAEIGFGVRGGERRDRRGGRREQGNGIGGLACAQAHMTSWQVGGASLR